VAEAGETVVEDSPGGVVYVLHNMEVDDSKGPKMMRELAEADGCPCGHAG